MSRASRTLAFLITAVPMGLIGAAVLLVGWILVPLLAITPAVVPVLIGFRAAVGWIAEMEARLAGRLLGVRIRVPALAPSRRGYWGRALDIVSDRVFAKQQAYVLLRFLLGSVLAIAEVALIGSALGAIALPIYYHWSHPDITGWRVDTIWKALLYVPAGLVLLWLSVLLLAPLRALSVGLARGLLDECGEARPLEEVRRRGRRALGIHAVFFVAVNALLVVIWAATTRAFFWPAIPLVALLLPLMIHAWVQVLKEQPWLVARSKTRALAIHKGVYGSLVIYFVLSWISDGGGYFWEEPFSDFPFQRHHFARSTFPVTHNLETICASISGRGIRKGNTATSFTSRPRVAKSFRSRDPFRT